MIIQIQTSGYCQRSTLFHSKFVLNLIDKEKENREYNEENYFNLQDLVRIVSL